MSPADDLAVIVDRFRVQQRPAAGWQRRARCGRIGQALPVRWAGCRSVPWRAEVKPRRGGTVGACHWLGQCFGADFCRVTRLVNVELVKQPRKGTASLSTCHVSLTSTRDAAQRQPAHRTGKANGSQFYLISSCHRAVGRTISRPNASGLPGGALRSSLPPPSLRVTRVPPPPISERTLRSWPTPDPRNSRGQVHVIGNEGDLLNVHRVLALQPAAAAAAV